MRDSRSLKLPRLFSLNWMVGFISCLSLRCASRPRWIQNLCWWTGLLQCPCHGLKQSYNNLMFSYLNRWIQRRFIRKSFGCGIPLSRLWDTVKTRREVHYDGWSSRGWRSTPRDLTVALNASATQARVARTKRARTYAEAINPIVRSFGTFHQRGDEPRAQWWAEGRWRFPQERRSTAALHNVAARSKRCILACVLECGSAPPLLDRRAER